MWLRSLLRLPPTPTLRQALLAPSALSRLLPPARGALPHRLAPALAGHPAPAAEPAQGATRAGGLLGPMAEWLDSGILWMAVGKPRTVQKKRNSYHRKRTRQSGDLALSGPKHKPHLYMCPVCERMRAPHRVCDREDCQTYFRHRWF